MGRVVDPETGLLYLRNRYYDPGTGQFLSRDPLVALSRSAYGYVDGDPLNGTDPTGLSKCGKSKGLFDDIGSFVDCVAKGDVKGAAVTVRHATVDVIIAPVALPLETVDSVEIPFAKFALGTVGFTIGSDIGITIGAGFASVPGAIIGGGVGGLLGILGARWVSEQIPWNSISCAAKSVQRFINKHP